MNKKNFTVTLQDNESHAQISVKLTWQTLRLTFKNPHGRISRGCRLYTRRETNLTTAIASGEWAR
jgi:hypothetical protein